MNEAVDPPLVTRIRAAVFGVAYGGYDVHHVDTLLESLCRNLCEGRPIDPGQLTAATFPRKLRGYRPEDVDALLTLLGRELAGGGGPPRPTDDTFDPALVSRLRSVVFGVAFRGYDAGRVDAFLESLCQDLCEGRPIDPARLTGASFPQKLRGYRSEEVDALLARLGREVAGGGGAAPN